jgi:hypothetical protein
MTALLAASLLSGSCGGEGMPSPDPTPSPRSYVMGFSPIPTRFDAALVAPTVDMWARRADAGLVLQEPPWTELLAGRDPEALVRANPLEIANYFRSKGLRILGSIDPTNGLDRAVDAAPLVAAGRSLAEPAVREAYRRYVAAFVRLVRPEALTVASETNLVRVAAPASLYAAVVAAANEAAAAARLQDPAVRLMITVQVEVANGRLPGGVGAGIARDRGDFPFAQALGLSSYPYLAGVGDPEQLPLDYYARVVAGGPLPVFVIEGGWPSGSLPGVVESSPDEQRRYIERQVLLLDAAGAEGWFQITFTDLDTSAFPPGIVPFALLGPGQRQPAAQARAAGLGRRFRPASAAALIRRSALTGVPARRFSRSRAPLPRRWRRSRAATGA